MKTPSFSAPVLAVLAAFVLAAPSSNAALDYGDGSSATLTAKAWTAYGAKNYADAVAYTSKCIDSYKKIALDQEKVVAATHSTDKGVWALNDVATCYYIEGMAKEGLTKISDAIADYKFLLDNFPLAECRDPKGFAWKPADPAKQRLAILSLDHPVPDVIEKIDLDYITVKTATAVSTYRITASTKIDFKGQPANLTDIKPGMAVVVTPAADATVAGQISVSDAPRKQ